MKILSYAFSLMLVCFLSSCVMTKTYTREEKQMITGNESFVVKNDGKKITGKDLKLVPKASQIKLDGQEFNIQEITAYQNNTASFVKFGTTNYIWTRQLKRGKINLYYYDIVTHKSYYNGTKYVTENITDTHFVFSKANEALVELSITAIGQLLKDNKAAYAKFIGTFGEKDKVFLPKQLQNHPKVLFESIDIYNGDL